MYKFEFIEKANKKHKIDYDYSLVLNIVKTTDYINIICPKHGIFKILVSNFLAGSNCKRCAEILKLQNPPKRALTNEQFIQKAKNIHDESRKLNNLTPYDYSITNYINATVKVRINCLEYDENGSQHGIFIQLPGNHLQGSGCSKCGKNIWNNKNVCTQEQFIQKAKAIHDNSRKLNNLTPYDYHKVNYINNNTKVWIHCQELDGNGFSHGDFEQTPHNHLQGSGCPKCGNNGLPSKKEIILYDWLSQYINCEQSNQNILNGKELDIYIPSKKIAIEFNGTYWHATKPKKYHYQKSLECEKQGIRLIHVWEWLWDDEQKQKILKNIILSACGLIENKIYARKCKSEIIDLHTCSKETKQEIIDFFNNNNINGYRGAKYCCLLRYNNMIVHAFTFGNAYAGKGKYEYELIRGASLLGYSVIGGSSKLWSLFIKEINPKSVVYYVDYNYFDGNSLKYLKPEFKYIKHSLSFWNYDRTKNQIKNRQPEKHKEVINNENILQIYGAGTKTYVYNNYL